MLKDRIRELRLAHKMSQSELGNKLNRSQQAIGKWESGASEPDASCIVSMAQLFAVSTDYILEHNKVSIVKDASLPPSDLNLITLYHKASLADQKAVDLILGKYRAEKKTPAQVG